MIEGTEYVCVCDVDLAKTTLVIQDNSLQAGRGGEEELRLLSTVPTVFTIRRVSLREI